jgi:hypothetical protein
VLALVPLLAPAAVALAGAVACLILLYIVDMWFRSWAFDEGHDDPGLFARVFKWGLGRVRSYVRKLEKRVVARLSNAVAARSPLVVRGLNNATELVDRLGTTFTDLPAQTHRALYTLRHVTMPDYVTGRLEPVFAQLNSVRALAQASVNTLTDVSIEIANGLRALPWGVPAGLPNRVATLMETYNRLWDHVWDRITPRVNTLWDELVPQLRRDVDSLLRGAAGNIGTRLQALTLRVEAIEAAIEGELRPLLDDAAGRILELEREVFARIPLRLDALQAAIDALASEIFTGIGTGFAALVERVVVLENAVSELIPERFAAVEAAIAQLRAELEQGIETGLEVFRARLEAVEEAVTVTIPARLATLEATVDALAAEIFGEIGEGLRLVIGRIEIIENQIRDDILPRLSALEAALAPAALAALVLATLQAAAPQLFCRNVTGTASRICAQDEDLWESLLAGLLIFAIALNPREIAAAGSALTGILGSVIAETVNH